MRPLRIVGAVTVLALVSFLAALNFPAESAQAQARIATQGATGASTTAASSEASSALAGSAQTQAQARTPIVIAKNVAVRALGVQPQISAASGAAGEYPALQVGTPAGNTSDSALLFLTNADQPNRIFAFAAISNALAAHGATGAANKMALFAGLGGVPGSLGDGGAATGAQFDLKLDSLLMRSSVAVAPDGSIYVADTRNSTIRGIAGADTSEPGIIRSVAGRFGPRQNVELAEPLGLALDRAGNLYIADHTANAIFVLHTIASAMTHDTLEILAHVSAPASIAVTADGSQVFAASPDTGVIVQIDTKTRAAHNVNIPAMRSAERVSAETLDTGLKSGATNAPQMIPTGLATDGSGNLFVSFVGAAGSTSEILRVDAATSKVTVAARGLNSPGDIAFDSNGNLFVADQGSRRILELQGAGAPVASVTLAPTTGSGTIDFGDQPIDGTTTTQSFTLSNNSGSTLTQIATSFQSGLANFSVTGTSCTSTLANGASCTFNVAFTPQSSGAIADSLVVTYTIGQNAPATVTADVTGTGDDYQIALAPGQAQQVSINPGVAATFMMQIVPDGTFSGPVTLVCPTNLPVATTCTFTSNATNPPPNTLVVNVTAGQPAPFSVIFQTTSTATKTMAMGPGFMPMISGGRAGSSGVQNLFHFPALGVIFVIGIFCAMFSFAGLRNQARRYACRENGFVLLRLQLVPTFALLVVCAAFLGGCGSGNKTKPIVTPAGTTNLTIQGSAQNASRGFTVTLVVN